MCYAARVTNQRTIGKRPRHHAGKASLSWIALIALLAIASCVVIVLLINRGGPGKPAPAQQVSQEQIDQTLEKLQTDFQTAIQEEQDLGRIAAQARAFTEKYPDEQGGYVLLAQTRMGQNQWDEAYEAWQAALGFDDNAFELCKMTALCAAKLGHIDAALKYYQQAVKAANDRADSEVYAALGRLHLTQNETERAKAMYELAVKAPGPGEKTNYKHQAYAGLADVASVQGDTAAALSWIDRAIKLSNLDSDADSAGYHIKKARIYMDAGQDEDAVTMLEYTWSQFPDALWRIESARLRARLYERAGQLDTAVDYLQTVVEVNRQSEKRHAYTLADFTALLAKWQIKAGRTEAAKVSLHNLQVILSKHPAIDELKSLLY